MLESKPNFFCIFISWRSKKSDRTISNNLIKKRYNLYCSHHQKFLCTSLSNFFFFVITEHLEVYPTTETIIYDENGIPIRSGSPDEVELSKSIKEDGPFNPKTGFTPG